MEWHWLTIETTLKNEGEAAEELFVDVGVFGGELEKAVDSISVAQFYM